MKTMTASPISGLKTRSELHLVRKAWHVTTVFSMFLIYHYASPLTSFLGLLTGATLFIPLDFLRQNNPRLNAILVGWMRPIIREHESHTLAGTTYLITGVFLIYAFCPRPVIELTLLFLAFGDPVASLCGIHFGRDRIFRNKTLQGTLGAFVVCSILAGVYFYSNGLMLERLFVAVLVAGFAGALCELIPIGKLDDNLTFPLLCSICLWAIFYLFGAFV